MIPRLISQAKTGSLPRNSTSWKLAGTKTFRLSSAKILGIWGSNLQNVSEDLKDIYIPNEGKCFCKRDQSGAEARVVAYLCKPGAYRDLFKAGVKVHTYVAAHLFKSIWEHKLSSSLDKLLSLRILDLPFSDDWKTLASLIKSHDDFYFMAKIVCHASNYDIRPPKVALTVLKESRGRIRLSVKQSESFAETYQNLFSEIPAWRRSTERELSNSRILYNLFGYPRYFHGAWTEELLRDAYSWKPQSTVGTITNLAVTDMQEHIEREKLSWDILNNEHDSFLVQCPKDEWKACLQVMQGCIERELKTPSGEIFTMKSEAFHSETSWANMPEVPKDVLSIV